MKKMYSFVFSLLITLAISNLLEAQTLGNRYYWQENFSVSTAVLDTTFTDAYESCVIYSDTLDLDIKVGAPDTSNVTSQGYLRLNAGRSLVFESPLRLKRVYVKTVNGSGKMYIVGIKKTSQF